LHRDAREQAQARAAYERLSIAADALPGFTAIELHRAMAALSACDVPEAREALGRALYGGQTRGTTLVSLELALRAGGPGERSAARAHLERLVHQPESRGDPWVAAIERDVGARCPVL